jgi:hypothetical protein
MEFCLVFLGAEAGYAETVARRYIGICRVSEAAWVSNSAIWLAKRSSLYESSRRAGALGNSPEVNAGRELSPETAVPSRHSPAQPPGQTPLPVERAPEEGRRNDGEESGTRLFDDGQRSAVYLAMAELAEKHYEGFDEIARLAGKHYEGLRLDEKVSNRFRETAKRFVKDDEEVAVALMVQISSEFGFAVGDLSFEQVDQYMRTNPAMLELSPIMQILAELRVSDLRYVRHPDEILWCLRSHPGILDAIVHKIYIQSVLPTLLPRFETWQIERYFEGRRIEISKGWWFRSDGTCGTEGGTGTWCAADYGRLTVKIKEEFTFVFSSVGPYLLGGTVQERGSSVVEKTVLRAESSP